MTIQLLHRRLSTTAAAVIFTGLLVVTAVADAPPNPEVGPPVTGGSRGQPFGAATAPAGYLEEERFFSGTARSYEKRGTWGLDGVWEIVPAATAPYKVRMLIRRPIDPARFNGVLVVEWLNVSSLIEGAADYIHMQEEIVRGGYAWVGIGAQAAGVNTPALGLRAWDPARYGSLVHPGDAYSYDIFSQGAQALRHPASASADLLGGLRVQKMIAIGRSQSAFRLVTYINAFHPVASLFDGYLVHSRGSNAAGLRAEGLGRDASSPIPSGAHIRTDLTVPVLDLQTEGDMAMLRAHLTRQDANPHYRRWEVAGAAHAETPRWVAEAPPALDMGPGCREPVNAAPHHAVTKAALRALTVWVRDGTAPVQSPAIILNDAAAADPVARDKYGNAAGGIRLPELEAPTARMDGLQNAVGQPTPGRPNFCSLYGHTVPFDAATLGALYPSHQAYVDRFSRAADALERAGFWLAPEAAAAKAAAAESTIGRR